MSTKIPAKIPKYAADAMKELKRLFPGRKTYSVQPAYWSGSVSRSSFHVFVMPGFEAGEDCSMGRGDTIEQAIEDLADRERKAVL